MKPGQLTYSVELLTQLWAAGKTHKEIAGALGCADGYVCKLCRRHGLPKRRRKYTPPVPVDPTPEEIRDRAAECRAKHLASLVGQTHDGRPSPGIRQYALGRHGFSFV